MKRIAILIMFGCLPVLAQASGGTANEYIVTAPLNLDDKPSLQRGAQIFVNHCMGCHSAKFMRYERVAQDLDIPQEMMEQNLMFTTDKIGNTMVSAMPKDLGEKWFGAAPPDLTLDARVRGADWVYSYLTNFYPDESRPWGTNNHVYPDVGMPNVLEGMKAELGKDEFNSRMADLTNFMVYMSEPIRAERERLGWWVLLFLAILFVPVYFLNREYWKDVH